MAQYKKSIDRATCSYYQESIRSFKKNSISKRAMRQLIRRQQIKENASPLLITIGVFVLLFVLRFTKVIALEVNNTFFIYGTIALVISGVLFWKKKHTIAIPIVLIVILLGIFYVIDRAEELPEQQSFEQETIEFNTTTLRTTIDFYKGTLQIEQGKEGRVSLLPEQDTKKPKVAVKEQGEVTTITLEREQHFFQNIDADSDWEVMLPSESTGELNINIQDTQATISELAVQNITFTAEQSNIALLLNTQQEKVSIKVTDSVLLLTLPENVQLTIKQNNTLVRNRAGLTQEKNVYGVSKANENTLRVNLIAERSTIVLE